MEAAQPNCGVKAAMGETPRRRGRVGMAGMGQKPVLKDESLLWRLGMDGGPGQLQATELGLCSCASHPQEGHGGTCFLSLSAPPLRLGLSEMPRVLWTP